MHYLTFIVSAVIIIVAGMYLARSADEFAEKTGLGRLIVGSLLLAGATSLTELFVGYNAVISDDAQMAMGNLVGATLVNLMILALADILHKGKASSRFSKASATHALAASVFIILMIITAMSIFLEEYIKGVKFLNAGIGSWIILITYVLTLKINFKNQKYLEKSDHHVPHHRGKAGLIDLLPCLIIFFACAVVLAFASPYLVQSAEKIANELGFATSFIGLTLIALTTSLPELVSTIQSVKLGSYELALGNIIGSSIYNIILIALLDFVAKESIYASVPPLLIFSCLTSILAMSIAIVGQLYQVERSTSVIEPDAVAIIGVVLLSMYITFQFS